MSGVPVLMYHALEDEGHPAGAKDPGEQLYVLSVRQFREQMEYLSGEGYQTVLLKELAEGARLPAKPVVLTFDDGHRSNHTLALPILREYGFRAVFFITSGWLGLPGYLAPDEVAALHAAGMEVGCHGLTHSYLSDLDTPLLERELREPLEALSGLIDARVASMSAPGGRLDARGEQLARRLGYQVVCSSSPGMLQRSSPQGMVPRFPIRSTCRINEFAAIVGNDPRWLQISILRDRVLRGAKELLGNRNYERIRALLLRA